MKSFHLIKPYFIENRFKVLIGLVSLLIVDSLQLFIPRIIKWAVDDLASFQADHEKLINYGVYIAFAAVFIGLFRFSWRRCLIGMSRLVEEKLRNRLFTHIQTLPASYFDRVKTGDIMAHATNDLTHIRMATGMGIVALTDAIVLGTASICFMAYINLKLTLLAIIPMPLIIISARFLGRKMHTLYRSVQAKISELTEEVRERFSGIRIIKAYNMEGSSNRSVEHVSKEVITERLRLVRVMGILFPIMMLFTNISVAIVLYFGGSLTVTGAITPGDFVAFISYLGLMTWPMMAIGWVINLIQRGGASLERINIILSEKGRDEAGRIELEKEKVRGDVVFEDVSFTFKKGGPKILNGINLTIFQGETLGVVGPPGSGKTALVNLIPRIYEPASGKILIDGIDTKSLSVANLRSFISFMPQEPFLFSGTIDDNILFGRRDASGKELEKVAEDSSLKETIESMPNGYKTVIGEKGVVLSGGQKQRIALARALINKGGILILDDPISQVDMETGAALVDSIKNESPKRTKVIVSHRYSAVRDADRIIVLEDGKIAESGTHEELMANNGYYAKTFALQAMEKEMAVN